MQIKRKKQILPEKGKDFAEQIIAGEKTFVEIIFAGDQYLFIFY